MSQQINLLLPELRPRFDWLALPVVLGAALVGLLFVVAMALFGAPGGPRHGPQCRLAGRAARLAGTGSVAGGDAGGASRRCPASAQVATARLATAQRQGSWLSSVRGRMRLVAQGLLQGLARQTMNWLALPSPARRWRFVAA